MSYIFGYIMSEIIIIALKELIAMLKCRVVISLILGGAATTVFGVSFDAQNMFFDVKMNSGYYFTADDACEAAMPNSNFVSQGASYDVDYGLGCLVRALFHSPPHDIFGQGLIKAVKVCPEGFVYDSGKCELPDDDTCKVGNPISIASGIKKQLEVDFSLPGNGTIPLQISRYYSSFLMKDVSNYGYGWTLKPYYFHIENVPLEQKIYVYRSPNRRWLFTLDSGSIYRSADMPDVVLESVVDSEGEYWRLKGSLYDQEIYSRETGMLLKLVKNGYQQNLIYSDISTPDNIASRPNLLITISDSFGRSLDLFYDDENLLSHVDFDNDTILTYSYGEDDLNSRQLLSVTYADGSRRQYEYMQYAFTHRVPIGHLGEHGLNVVDVADGVSALDPAKMNAQYFVWLGYSVAPLIGITDENGQPYAEWRYDDQGRAISSEHANGAERVDLSFNNYNNTTTVTNALGKQTVYHYELINNVRKLTEIEGVPSASCAGANKTISYDASGFIASKSDWNGNTTTYTRDAQGRELSRTEAAGTPEARTVTTTWDTDLNKPQVITEPDRVIEHHYTPEGRLLSREERSRY
jgi:YD repeat-containing protein